MNNDAQIQALLDHAAAEGVQVRVTWTITHDSAGQPLTSPRPMTVILGADRIDALGGTDGDTGAALEVHAGAGPADPDALTLLAYRKGESAQDGPQQLRLQDWSKTTLAEDALAWSVRALAARTRPETAAPLRLFSTLLAAGRITPDQLRAFNMGIQDESRAAQRRERGDPEG